MVDTSVTPLHVDARSEHRVDFDLHGLVGVTLLDPGPDDLAAVVAQLGAGSGPLGRPADITIRYVDRLPAGSRLRYLGRDEAAFTDDAFLVLQGRHKRNVRVKIPMASIGHRCEIVAERGVGRIPLLIAIINLTLLANGGVALHASSFESDGRGVVVTGWSKGGKTEALLAFLSRGARYVSDEWTHIDLDSRRVGGLREPVRVWDWHLAELPELRRQASFGARARLGALRAASGVDLHKAPGGARLAHAVTTHRFVDLPPELLSGAPDDGVATASLASTTFDRLFLVTSAESKGTAGEAVDPMEVADRMVASLAFERAGLLAWYEAFRFAFPGESNPLLEGARELEHERLRAAFAGVPAFEVVHPYPVHLDVLADVMTDCLRDAR